MGQSDDSSVGHPKNCALYNRIKNTKHEYGGLFSFRRPQQDYAHQGWSNKILFDQKELLSGSRFLVCSQYVRFRKETDS